MTHPEKTLLAQVPVGDVGALAVVITGLLAMSCPAGWQVAWLVVLGVVAALRRWGRRLAESVVVPPATGQGRGG